MSEQECKLPRNTEGSLFEDALLHTTQEPLQLVQVLGPEVQLRLECDKAGPILDGWLVGVSYSYPTGSRFERILHFICPLIATT